jgi:O-antigen/teichoic acid export membrane protein
MKPRPKGGLVAVLITWGVPLFVEIAALLRSVALAWGIGVDNLGRALVLALTLRLAEMLSDVGIERLVQVSPRRSEADFMAALQGASLVRGVIVAGVMLLLAFPMSISFADGASAAAFAALALVPLVRGLLHLDYRRAEAERRYGPMALVEGMAALLMLTSLPVMITVFGDARAMVGLILVQVVGQVVFSHVVADQRYGMRFDREVMAQVWHFGAPLVVNAGLMFVAVQADRYIVAGFYGWAEVAAYGVAFQLASLPAQIAGRAAASNLTAALAGPNGAQVLNSAMVQFALLALCFALGFALIAPWAIGLVYGSEMQPSAILALGLGLAAGLRILRTPLSVRAVAVGRTGDPARANLLRAAVIVPSLGAALLGLPLATLAFIAAAGEAAAAWRAHRLLAAQAVPSSLPSIRALSENAV